MDLTGALLVAMPGMMDMRFERSVIYICAHSGEGAMGLIINKPATDVTLGALMEQLDIKAGEDIRHMQVHIGGPVESSRGFVLHGPDYTSKLKTLQVGGDFGMTATLDVLEDIAIGEGPRNPLIMLGYAGWGAGQLESEIAQNGWLTVAASPDLVFASDNDGKWAAAVGSLGIDPLGLSGTAGRA
ncbi:MAG: YqgE/AlgH family protein [Tateyamaria sp.]|uniref:YqgE/AlgH family protein n=1 Tax=Tateyamaria sp. TaxID=1929288 RepID=UPI0032A13EBA